MRIFRKIMILVILGFILFFIYNQNDNLKSSKKTSKRSSSGLIKVNCQYCIGEGNIIIGESSRPVNAKCPVCGGKSYLVRRLNKGDKICSSCKGMGMIYEKRNNNFETYRAGLGSSVCGRCGRTGVIRNKSAIFR